MGKGLLKGSKSTISDAAFDDILYFTKSCESKCSDCQSDINILTPVLF